MQVEMSLDEVASKLQEMQQAGDSLNKKKVKQINPSLMQHALYYYPSWEHALKSVGVHSPS